MQGLPSNACTMGSSGSDFRQWKKPRVLPGQYSGACGGGSLPLPRLNLTAKVPPYPGTLEGVPAKVGNFPFPPSLLSLLSCFPAY
jgi:hypothetical protein